MTFVRRNTNTYPQQDTKKLQAAYGNTGCRDGILGKVLEGSNNGVHGAEQEVGSSIVACSPSGSGGGGDFNWDSHNRTLPRLHAKR